MLAVHQQAYPDAEVVVVRTCPVIGPDHGMPLDELLEMPVVLSPTGRDPPVQLLHVDDAAEAYVRAAARPGLRGVFNIAGSDPIPLSVLAGVLEKPVVSLPRWAARGASHAVSKLRLVGFGADDLRMLHDGVPLATGRPAGELEFAPRYSTRQTLAVWRTRYGCAPSGSRP
jgi:UDP-glucose 4-epimerase